LLLEESALGVLSVGPARALLELGLAAVLLKGGHGAGAAAVDL